jgi:hypothetical protein
MVDTTYPGRLFATSEALSIWQSAIDANPALKSMVEGLPNVIYATRHYEPEGRDPEGVLVYLQSTKNGGLASPTKPLRSWSSFCERTMPCVS